MANAALIYENGHEPEFVIYTTNPIISLGLYNAHVQVTYKENGKRVWMGGYGYIHDSPEYPVGEYAWIMDIHQYIEWLKINRELNKQPLPDKEHRDKYWPKAREVLK